MSDEQKLPFEQAGESAFRKYISTETVRRQRKFKTGKAVEVDRPSGPGGMELFHAYVERRAADFDRDEQRIRELLASFDGMPLEQVGEARAELLRLQIFRALDPIIQGLLEFCGKRYKDDTKAQLADLRGYLQIDDGRAPIDNLQTQRRWEIEQRWIAAYLRMQDDKQHKSEDMLSKEIAASLPESFNINDKGIGPRQVLNHWKDKKKREPWQAQWAMVIEDAAKYRDKLEKKRAKEAKAAKKAAPARPKKSDYRKNNL